MKGDTEVEVSVKTKWMEFAFGYPSGNSYYRNAKLSKNRVGKSSLEE